MKRTITLLSLLTLACVAHAARIEGTGIRRCTSPDGSILYTDRDCASFGATDRLPPPGSQRRGSGGAIASSKGVVTAGTRPECAASPDALVRSLGVAWQSRDVNQVAGLVNWHGTGSGTAHRVLRQLRDALKQEPLDITLEAPPVWSEIPDPYGGPSTFAEQPGSTPTNVRVDRVDAEGWDDSLRFGLRRDLGCYWLDVASLD